MAKSTERHTVVPRVFCFVFNKDSVLLMKASDQKEWHGTYDPPGGHIEKGESIIDAAKREVFEETGIKLRSAKLRGVIHVSNFFGKNVMLFVTSSTSESRAIKGNYEGVPEWVRIRDLDKIKLFEDVRPILDKIISMKNSEIFVGVSEFDGKDRLLSLDTKIH